ncbi:CARDB domain-containing protein [Methanolobus sp.]|uniref:CARDB domain-containing protein n=1 Tax=Methanolobus sp. TaxID=1874737 RepID=UPI0025DB3FCD|nr:CARDB domain-containing protein [Methanolobus sp.]
MKLKYAIICLIILLACSNTASAEIISHSIKGTILDTDTATIEFTIKNNGGEGPVNLQLLSQISGESQYFSLSPSTKAIYMQAGETQTVSFTIIPTDVKGDYEGRATLQAMGGTGLEDRYTFSYTIKDAGLMNETPETTTTDSNSLQTFIFVLIVFALLLIVGSKMGKK